MAELFNKTPQEAIAEAEAASDLMKALLEAFASLINAFAPGVTATKKKPLTIEVKKRPDIALSEPSIERKQKQIEEEPSIARKEKPAQPEINPEYGLIYGLGVNKLSSADCKTIAAIVTAKKGALIVGSDYDYVIRHNGKVLFETTMGEVTTHTRLPDVLHDKIVNLEAGVTSSLAPVSPTVAPSPEPNSVASIKDAVTTRAVADTAKLVESIKQIEQQVKTTLTNKGSLFDTVAAKPFLNIFKQIKKGIIPELKSEPSIGKFMDGIDEMFDEIDREDEIAVTESIAPDEIDGLDLQPEPKPVAPKKTTAKSKAGEKAPQSQPKSVASKKTTAKSKGEPKSAASKKTTAKSKAGEKVSQTPSIVQEVSTEVETPSIVQEPTPVEVETPSIVQEPTPVEVETPLIVQEVTPAEIEIPSIVQEVTPAEVEAASIVEEVTPAEIETPSIVQKVNTEVETPSIVQETNTEVETPTIVQEPTIAETTPPIGKALPTPTSPRDLKAVQVLFTIFGRNTNKEEHNTSNGREGILELPTGAKLLNKINSGIPTLSLVRGETEYELGSHNPETQQYSVHSGLKEVRSELENLRPHLDSKTWTIKPNSPVPPPVVKQTLPPINPTNFKPDLNNRINIEAEEALLAKVLTDPQAIDRATQQGISDRSFVAPLYQQIFKAAQSISTAGHEVNLMSVANEMSTQNPGIHASIATIIVRQPSGSLDSIATIVRSKQIQRDLHSTAAALKNDVSDLSKPVLYSTKENLKTLTEITRGKYNPIAPTPSISPDTTKLKDIQLEQQVISDLLQDPTLISKMSKIGLTSKSFERPEHQQIYATAVDLHTRGEEVNLVSVRDRLSTQPEAAAVAANLVESALPLATETGINRIISLSQRRELVDAADRLTNIAGKPGQSFIDLTNTISDHQATIKEIEERSPILLDLQRTENQPEPELEQDSQVTQNPKSRGK